MNSFQLMDALVGSRAVSYSGLMNLGGAGPGRRAKSWKVENAAKLNDAEVEIR